MDYLDLMTLPDLLDFIGWRNSYKKMIDSYEDIVAENEFRAKCKREDEQLRRLEEKENEYISKN